MLAIVIPAYQEFETLPKCLESLAASAENIKNPAKAIHVVVVVNQPIQTSIEANSDNQKTLEFLQQNQSQFPFSLHTIDCTKPGITNGVGEARKVGMDFATQTILKNDLDLIVSLDADATISKNYLSVLFDKKLNGAGFTLGFQHRFEEAENPQAMEFYDHYLRLMQRELERIKSPFSYISIGSALGTSKKYYKISEGMPAKNATEDFHFLNKLRKLGEIEHWPEVTVYPSPRKSTRVHLGTGFFLDQYEKNPQGATQQLLIPTSKDFDCLQDFLILSKKLFDDSEAENELRSKKEWREFILEHQIVDKLLQLKENSRSQESYDKKYLQVVDALFTFRFLRFLAVDNLRKPSYTPENSI